MISINQPACRFFGAAPEDLIGRKWTDLLLANRDGGTATRRYVELFAMQDNVANLELWPAGEARRPISATLFFRGTGGRRELTTVLHDSAGLGNHIGRGVPPSDKPQT